MIKQLSGVLLFAGLLTLLACGGGSTAPVADSKFSTFHIRPGTGDIFATVGGSVLSQTPIGFQGALNVTTFSVPQSVQYKTVAPPQTLIADITVDTKPDAYRFVMLTPTGVRQDSLANFPLPVDSVVRLVPLVAGNYDVYLTDGSTNLSTPIDRRLNVTGGGASIEWKLAAGRYRVILTAVGTTNVVADSNSFLTVDSLVQNCIFSTDGTQNVIFNFRTNVNLGTGG